jgi:2-polyprenyl-3-methyl-5-hydroxy-6-metoxy-1,4-benzoquinol methylase
MVPVLLRKVVSSFLRRNQGRGNPENYYASPQRYWETRHAEYTSRGSLIGVGCIELDEIQNLADYRAKWQRIETVLASAGPVTGRTLLDAGCGNGWFTAKCVALGFQVSAVDFSSEAIAAARKILGDAVTWHVGPLNEFAPARTYDVVLCIDVLFHIVDDEKWAKAVTNLGSLTSPDGLLVIQDHLIPEAQVLRTQSLTNSHCRWRSMDRYLAALGPAWKMVQRVSYELPEQKHLKGSGLFAAKDLLVFVRTASKKGTVPLPSKGQSPFSKP